MIRCPRNPTALIVDGETSIRQLVRVLLADAGFHPIWEAADGKTALSVAWHNQPDVIILDYMLPVMDGETIATLLRMLTPSSYIVLFSAVLYTKPGWADTYLDKMQVDEIADVALAGFREAPRQRDTVSSNKQ